MVEAEMPEFQSAYGSPQSLLKGARYEEDLESREVTAYSFLVLGDLLSGARELRSLQSLSERAVRRDELDSLAGVRARTQEMLDLISAGSDAVASKLSETRRARLFAFGVDEVADPRATLE
jgi:hypothetical protein